MPSPFPTSPASPSQTSPGYKFNGWEEYNNLSLVAPADDRDEHAAAGEADLLLHCQFPTSWSKVGWAYMMYVQNQIFRTSGPGNFETLVQAVAKDPAMLIWLDTDTSHRDDPNQNFARELMERFTMGAGNYTQEDVVQAARCFTGWELDNVSGEFFFNPYDNDNGIKQVPGALRALHRRGHRQHRLQRTGRLAPLGDLPAVVLVGLPDHPERPDRAGLRPRLRQGPQHHQPARAHVQPPGVRLAQSA